MADRIDTFSHDNLTFDVLDTGPLDGEVIVLLHGFPERASSWAQVSTLLNEQGYRTIAPDQRGYSPGARPRRRRDYTIDKLVGDVVALIETIGRPVHLVGHDWGSNVAWFVTMQNPDLVIDLTAFSVAHPAAFLRSLLGPQALHSWYMGFFQLPFVPELALSGQWAPTRYWMSRGGLGRDELARVREEIVDYGALTGGLNWYRALPFADRRSFGRRVQVPTTMVWSDKDLFLGRDAPAKTAEYVDAPYDLIVLPGVTHWIQTQAPESAAAAILERVSG
ncbi:alpha/beta fold hydrolase [Williamsia sterculiae]|nr:alpha/beta fold hydrolase [Williamsia sterculiae]